MEREFKNIKMIKWSKWTILLLAVIAVWYGKNLDTWGRNRIIQNDVISYYAYLPATFIFHDLSFSFAYNLPEDFEGTIWLQTAPNGKPYLKMTMGLAILWIPFFLLAHLYAGVSGIEALGYSWPYSLSVFIATIFYFIVGLHFLRKLLLRYFSEAVSAVTLLIIVMATNMLYYVISEPGMSHIYNFTLITTFLYYTIKWTENPRNNYIIILAVLAGIIVLIRPVNVFILIFPAFIGVSSLKEFLNRLSSNRKSILFAGGVALLIVIPQLIYWKIQTGHWIFNSYGEEGFFFSNPQIINGLFSYRKGWFVYTPVMFIAFLGVPLLYKKVPGSIFPIILFISLNIYVVFSWWCWWYGGSFGARPMIDMYGVMALPLAALINAIRQNKFVMMFSILLLIGFIWLNQFQMSQYRTSLLHWDSMTKEAYFGIFGKKQQPEGYNQMIQAPDYEKALKGENEYSKK